MPTYVYHSVYMPLNFALNTPNLKVVMLLAYVSEKLLPVSSKTIHRGLSEEFEKLELYFLRSLLLY